MRLYIKFLFVRLRFRYPFFSPVPHGYKPWESLWGCSATSSLVDFHHRQTACPSYKKRKDRGLSSKEFVSLLFTGVDLGLQISEDKVIQFSVHDRLHVARLIAAAMVLDQRIWMHDIRADL